MVDEMLLDEANDQALNKGKPFLSQLRVLSDSFWFLFFMNVDYISNSY